MFVLDNEGTLQTNPGVRGPSQSPTTFKTDSVPLRLTRDSHFSYSSVTVKEFPTRSFPFI